MVLAHCGLPQSSVLLEILHMMDVEEVAAVIYLYHRRKYRQKNKHRFWIHPLLVTRHDGKEFNIFISNLKKFEDKFFGYTRMSVKSYEELLTKLYLNIRGQDTRFRISISPEEKLIITIRYLATGCTFAELHYTFRIGASTIAEFVREVCSAIWLLLKESCLPKPSQQRWLDIAKGFSTRANFPNCIGAIDGKHIRVIKPCHSGSMYYNYKQFFSIILMAICDSNYKFITIDVGACGKFGDSAVYQHSNFYKKMIAGELEIPESVPISQVNTIPMPYVLVGDEAFPLSTNLMRPYAKPKNSNLNTTKRIYNYRHSRARRYVECSFGILSNKWRIFHRPLNVDISLATDIIKACCILHNYVRDRDGYNYEDTLTCYMSPDVPETPRTYNRIGNNIAERIRDSFAQYFEHEGKLEWQEKYI
ncbi:uncharacterized protein LOC128682057 [Plodia interpunctella]|uniref:uncharacterized protein LOC128674722 n=1 Tax=Plodia interpunctella TaxID=58824 RepID=UPI0023680B85|nr:uncharacterized protein LOC128674722 [Plodia interpunctella]XP_053616218.1 uncharacterized protein LOC128678609 [Plodia interpunctella]XP_053618441.1 uncharacterized protein LOC128679933 [Plodia interpunctella]XP_053622503.1 uncharacterized protein LOC128682057 [Plodia interpunctella]